MKMAWLNLACLALVASFAARGSDTPPTSITLCGAAALYCQPYAEKCPACKDCTKCGHCSNGGKCSVCFTR